MMERVGLLKKRAEQKPADKRDHTVPVAMDGIDAVGKTTLADESALALKDQCERVLRAEPGSEGEVRRRYQARYLPAQQLYLDSCRPRDRGDAITHNDDPANPRLTPRRPPGQHLA
jgi:hypothetical protein